jgi:hypothetical protein
VIVILNEVIVILNEVKDLLFPTAEPIGELAIERTEFAHHDIRIS